MLIRNQRAFAAGALFLVVSVFYFLMSFKYATGTAARMGPGFFPRMVAILLGAIALGVLLSSLTPRAKREKLEGWDVKGLLWIAGSVALFGLLLAPPHWFPVLNLFTSFGLVFALAALIIISSLASPEFTWIGTLVSTAILIVFCVGTFVYGISLQFPVWPILAR